MAVEEWKTYTVVVLVPSGRCVTTPDGEDVELPTDAERFVSDDFFEAIDKVKYFQTKYQVEGSEVLMLGIWAQRTILSFGFHEGAWLDLLVMEDDEDFRAEMEEQYGDEA